MSSTHQHQHSHTEPHSHSHTRHSVEIPRPGSGNSDALKRWKDHVMASQMPSEIGTEEMEDDITEIGEGHFGEDQITLASSSRMAGQSVTPFLAKHIPEQYAPLGNGTVIGNGEGTGSQLKVANPNTKYCYRHRPDSKCRRTADEPTMENLQRELETLSQADQQGISHVWSLFSAAPAKHRNLMLQGILTQCCFPQLSYLSATVRDLIRIDFVTALPSEISFKILCYLDTTSLCKAAQVSQKWRILADDDVVWHKMCEQHIDRKCTKCGWGLPLLERKRLRDWKRQQQLRATGRGLNEWSPNLTPIPDDVPSGVVPSLTMTTGGKRDAAAFRSDGLLASPEASKRQRLNGEDSYFVDKPKFRPWKDVYKDRFKVGTNWKYGRAKIKLFRGHTNGVMCLQFDDNILATGSYDATIKIWDIKTQECIRTLKGHTQGIRALQFDDTKLISGSLDKTIKIWNWRTGECLSTYRGHTNGVIGLHFDGNLLASGSSDKSIRIWNFSDKGVYSLRGHTDWVNSLKLDLPSRTLFSASDDCTIRLWDLDTKRTIRIFEGHVGQVQQITLLPAEYEPADFEPEDDDGASSVASTTDLNIPSINNNTTTSPSASPKNTFDSWPCTRPQPPRYFVTSGLDSTIRLWDVHTGRCLKTFFGHVEGVWALAADTLRVVSGSEDHTIKVWDARTGKCEKTFFGPTGPVTCLALSDSGMCTGSEDCEVRLYSFRGDDGGGSGVGGSQVGAGEVVAR